MKIKSVIELLIAGLSGYFALYFYLNNEIIYAVLLAVTAFIFIGLFIKCLFRMSNPYDAELKKIFRTYDSILVEIEILPKLSDKKIVKTKYFKDMVNVQFEIRKPIYYLKTPISCTFVIMTEDTAYIYEVLASSFQNEKIVKL